MGLFQQAYNTYEYAEKDYAGRYDTGCEPLAPIFHWVTTAAYEITIDAEGNFVTAKQVDPKDGKTIFPVTEDSLNRTSGYAPHMLCECLRFLEAKEKRTVYCEHLQAWAESEWSHPMLTPILTYVKKATVLQDIWDALASKKEPKDGFVRWRVNGLPGEEESACWKNKELQQKYIQYYSAIVQKREKNVCMVSGQIEPICDKHASLSGKAKLISSQDKDREFSILGRFLDDKEAMTVGIFTSFKAHNALKWVIANQGYNCEGEIFVCWNPEGKELPKVMSVMRPKGAIKTEQTYTPSEYKEYLRNTLKGWQTDLPIDAKTIVAGFNASTQGRLAMVYYSEMQARDFVERLEYWDETCCWPYRNFGIQSPSLYKIALYAYGTLKDKKIEPAKSSADEIKRAVLKLVNSRLERGSRIPREIANALAQRARMLMLYDNTEESKYLRETLLFTACAVIKKYRHDYHQEEWDMALEKERKDRSYQYGRLLAVLEKAELDGSKNDGKSRETNAIRMQGIFARRPRYASRTILEKVKRGYYRHLTPKAKTYYEKLIGQIMDQIGECDDNIDKPLEDTYLLGYYLQKNDLYTKKPDGNEADNAENEAGEDE